ncbi:MAG: hypothetical protein V2I51_18835 [Anderseniella sp.]|jgi:hypothetical protein|nr:hypothetical protein [Anderseniella sp.]
MMEGPAPHQSSGDREAELVNQLFRLQSDIAAIRVRRSACLDLAGPDIDRYARLERAEKARMTRRSQLLRGLLES